VSTLTSVTEVPEGEFVQHPGEVLRRVEAGEEIVVTIGGKPVVDLRRHPRAGDLSWDELWAALERIPPDPSFAADVRDLVGDESTDDLPGRR
jgi:antitoxin (DNA-binding transcriptional repressor) of toxin-antitoxin stability system